MMYLYGNLIREPKQELKMFVTGRVNYSKFRYSLGIAINSVLSSFGWNKVAYVYSNERDKYKCSILKNDIQDAFSVTNDVIINVIVEMKNLTFQGITQALGDVSSRARTEGYGFKRRFVLAAKDAGYLNEEYLYIFADTKSKGFQIPLFGGRQRLIWEDIEATKDGRDEEAKMAFGQTLVVSDHMGSGGPDRDQDSFSKEIISRMKDAPFNCVDDCNKTEYSYAAAYAGELHDCVYVYARALNSTLKKNATAFRNGTTIIENIEMTFDGMSGVVKMGKNGVRYPIFYFDALDKNGNQTLLGTVSVQGDFGRYEPLYTIESEIWWARGGVRPLDEPLCGFAGDQEEYVAALKHEAMVHRVDGRRQEIRQMRELKNDNLNRFIGFCLDGPQLMSLWKYCARGSLCDVIVKKSTIMDGFFVCALLRDIVDGLLFIHRSFLRCHGLLTSKCCLIDDRWQVKITSYGLEEIRKFDKLSPKDLLWTAPEILRQDAVNGSQEGDIYR
ncbi:hypothetical protein KIN20_008725 [Parelaphostrongylus tenuis]|uniref:guanylate cyclase n=1 Tax=Parelaphostrongylus tenuis TaxID=148309 RepID=A0AAD5MRI0_PARTN|nr:hypothetical protein KIN20_008725 [Parelaphostrongylus tenuis]